MAKDFYTIFFISFFITQSSFTQVDSSDISKSFLNKQVSEIGNQLNYSLDDGNRLFERISSFDKTDLFYSSIFLAGTASSFLLDDEIRDLAAKNQTSTMNSVTKVGEKYGDGYYALLVSGTLFTSGLLFDNSDLKNTGRILAEALLVSGITAQIIKIATGRSRPFTNEGSTSFKFFETENPHNSFPSGHTIVAFTTSAVLAASLKNVYASIVLYSLAGLTVYQRIYSDNHWISDTVLAAVIGTVVGTTFVKINEERFDELKGNKIDFDFSPAVFHAGIGLNLTLTF